jgi:hypothetical protein
MGLFDYFGRGKPADEPAASTSQSLPGPGDLLHSDEHPMQGRDHAEMLRDPSASALPGFPPATDGGERLYNPYQGLNAALESRGVKSGYKLPKQPEFLFSEEATVHRRSWSENLTYYTGMGYLSGILPCFCDLSHWSPKSL